MHPSLITFSEPDCAKEGWTLYNAQQECKRSNMSYDPRKAAQTIAYLAVKNGRQPLNILKAIKLVYLADRESVRRSGFTIQDEPHYSMPHGPVNSTTYRLINGEVPPEDTDGWSEFLTDRNEHRVGLVDPQVDADDLDELSDAEISVLDDVWEQFGHMTQWQLVDWTHDPHNVPEWEDPNGSSDPIPLRRMMDALGVPNAADQEAFVREHRRSSAYLKAL
jgi:uncharacterized phage-associated protein